MDAAFYVECNIKTANGFEPYGRFFIGHERGFAYELFNRLAGIDDVTEKSLLNVALIEIIDGLPVNVKIKGCSLEEIQENCRTITREAFKLFNLRL